MAVAWLDSLLIKGIFLILLWGLVHHLLAGIRYLVLDLDIGVSRKSANLSAMLVTLLALGCTTLIIVRMMP